MTASRRSARSRRRRCLRTPAASSMIARRSSGRASRMASRWPWLMITCCWRPTPVSESSSWMSSRRQGAPVDRVLAVPRAEERPGDGHLGHVRRELAGGVVDGERRPRHGRGRPGGRAHEDDVLHLRRIGRSGPLGAEHPGHGVDDVRFAAPVGPTTTVMPGSNSSIAGSAKDLNPLRERDFRNTGRLTLPAPSHDLGTRRPTTAGRSDLAMLAEERRAPAGLHADDGRAAPAAGLALTVVGLVLAW